jgi:hypothetical protein
MSVLAILLLEQVSPKGEPERNLSVLARLLLEQEGLPSEKMKGT